MSQHLAITEAGQRRLFFEEQLKQANQNLADAEEALKVTEQRTGLIELDSQAKALIESGAALRAQIAAKEVQIQGMQTYATGQNAQLVEAQQELDGLRAQLAELGGGGGDSTAIIVPKGQMTEAGMEYVRKLRAIKYYETIFTVLARQFELAKLDEAKEGAIIQVVDPAIPPDKKSSPKRTLIVIVATFVGLLVGIFLRALGSRPPANERRSGGLLKAYIPPPCFFREEAWPLAWLTSAHGDLPRSIMTFLSTEIRKLRTSSLAQTAGSMLVRAGNEFPAPGRILHSAGAVAGGKGVRSLRWSARLRILGDPLQRAWLRIAVCPIRKFELRELRRILGQHSVFNLWRRLVNCDSSVFHRAALAQPGQRIPDPACRSWRMHLPPAGHLHQPGISGLRTTENDGIDHSAHKFSPPAGGWGPRMVPASCHGMAMGSVVVDCFRSGGYRCLGYSHNAFGSPVRAPAASRALGRRLDSSFAGSTQSAYNDIDKAMLSHYSMNVANGIYAMAYRIVNIATLPVNALDAAALPRYFRESQEGAHAVKNLSFRLRHGEQRHQTSYVRLHVPCGADYSIHRRGWGFTESVSALRWLCLIPAFRGLHQLTGSAVTGMGFQRYRTMAQLAAAAFNFALNLLAYPALWLARSRVGQPRYRRRDSR